MDAIELTKQSSQSYSRIFFPLRYYYFLIGIWHVLLSEKGTTSLPGKHYCTFSFLRRHHVFTKLTLLHDYSRQTALYSVHIAQLRSETTKQTTCSSPLVYALWRRHHLASQLSAPAPNFVFDNTPARNFSTS